MAKRRSSHSPQPVRYAWLLLILSVIVLLGPGSFTVAAHLEENDGFCAACHTQPETDYFQRTQAGAVDLASQHHASVATRCIDCHAGPGLAGRVGAMSVGAGDLFAYLTGQARQPASLTVPIGDANCLKCHADVPATRDFNRHFHSYLARWQAIDQSAATCVSCHSAHTTGAGDSTHFLDQAKTEQVCERCHAVTDS